MATHTVTETVAHESTGPIKHTPFHPHPPQINKGNAALRLRNIKLDPARALEPGRKKLTTIESQRIMVVFKDAIKRIEIVTALPFIIRNFDRFRISFGVELVDMIKQHNSIQSSYRQIRARLDDLLHKKAEQLAKIAAKNVVEEVEEVPLPEEKKPEKRKSLFDDESLSDESDDEEEEEEEEGEKEGDEEAHTNERGGDEEEQEQPAVEEAGHAEDAPQNESPSNEKQSGKLSPSTAEKESVPISKASSNENEASSIHFVTSKDKVSVCESVLSDYDSRIEEAKRNLGLVAQQVSHSCKNILRLFTINPAAMKIAEIEDECIRDESSQNLVSYMFELRDILLHKLLTTPEEEAERMAYLDDITKREQHNACIMERLEKELQNAIADKEEEIHKKNDIIKRLQTDLHQIEKFSDESIRRTRAEAEKQEMTDFKNSDQKIQKLQAEINALQASLNTAITEHREIEADLRSKKYKVENEVDNWIQKYDQDLGDRQDEYEEIDIIYTDEKKQLLELEERFAALEKEYMGIMEERRLAREKRERAQRELALMVKAATTIQAFWRSYKVRKALSKRKTKKGGKKKGGKKGKK